MAMLAIRGFRGEVPRLSSRLLQDNYAKSAINVKLTSGRIDPLAMPLLVHTPGVDTLRSMYHYRYGPSLNWLVWDEAVDVVPSPAKADVHRRIYFGGERGPRVIAAAEAFEGEGPYPAAEFTLGVEAPRPGATLVPPSGTGDIRTYAFRFVSRYGEPSGVMDRGKPNTVTGTGATTGDWELDDLPPPPSNTAAITSANLTGNVCTLTLTDADATYGLAVGDIITVSGATGMAGLNAEHVLTAVRHDINAVSFVLTTTGAGAGGTLTRAIPHNLTGMKRQIFRTVGTNADLFFVAEIDATDASFTDDVANGDVGEILDSAELLPPPKGSCRMDKLANGSVALLTPDGELLLSSTDFPSGFPVSNRYAAPGGVAMVTLRNTLLVLTDDKPLYFVAERPESASPGSLGDYAPCVSARSVIPAADGCYYAGHDGFYYAGLSGAKLISGSVWTAKEWAPLGPENLMACQVDQMIVAAYVDQASQKRMLLLDLQNPDSIVRVTDGCDAMHRSVPDGLLYLAKGGAIYQFDGDDQNPYLGSWISKDYQLAPAVNFGVAQVHAEFVGVENDETGLQENLALMADIQNITGAYGDFEYGAVEFGGSNLNLVATVTPRQVQFTLTKNGVPVWSRAVLKQEAFRLPAGSKAEIYGLGVSTTLAVYSAAVAGTMEELKAGSQ